MQRLFWQILFGILGLFLATKLISGVSIKVIPGQSVYFGINFTQDWQILIFIGTVLGLINFFIKPILNLLTLPLRILTLGLFSFFLNMAIVFFLDVIFPELKIVGFLALFWTTLLITLLNFFFQIK